jgi:SAM-dependent methyltransferase
MPTATKRQVEVLKQADYGVDAPRDQKRLLTRGILLILLGAGFYVMNLDNSPGHGAALFAALGIIGVSMLAASLFMLWSSRVAKIRVRDEIIEAIPWRGDEKILDVGCGRGLLLIGAAKKVRGAAKATGIDLWREEDLSGNSSDAMVANAKAEGVADRIKVDTGDAQKLPYKDNMFDVVLSSLAVHNINDADGRSQAVGEMWRVLMPGGHIAIFDVARTGEYKKVLAARGAEVVRESNNKFLWCLPSRWFIVRKPA